MNDVSLFGRYSQLLSLVKSKEREISSVLGERTSPCNKKQLTSDWNQYLNPKAQEEFN